MNPLAIGAAIGALFVLLGGGKSNGGASPLSAKRISAAQRKEYLAKLENTYPSGQPISHTPRGTYLYQWSVGQYMVGAPNAIAWITKELQADRVVWCDMTILSSDRVILASAPAGVVPTGDWAILIENRRGLYDESSDSGPSGAPVVTPGNSPPTGSTPVNRPGDVPVAPQTPPPIEVSPTTGIPEVDEKLVSDTATPYQLRQIAAEFRKLGKKREADIVTRRADELYAQLRAKHAVLGGTPFLIRDRGDNLAGHLPYSVAQHYGGTIKQLGANNPGRKQWSDWQIGETWLLPLAWDAEAKAPPPMLMGGGKKSAKPAQPPATPIRQEDAEAITSAVDQVLSSATLEVEE